MIVYFSGNTFNQIIDSAIETAGEMVFMKEVANDFDFAKYIKQNIAKLDQVDMVILDISAFSNVDEEITNAIEMIRTMYDKLKIVIFAPYREAGDSFLTKCFNMGIWDIVTVSDFREIRDELVHCITEGMTFKDALQYKTEKTEKVIVKHTEKKTVYKKLIAVSGTESNIGVTHNAIILANYLRKKGFMVAIAEMNQSLAFEEILSAYNEKKFQEGYFTMGGVDFYSVVNEEKLIQIMEHSYNFIVLDFGTYVGVDRILFERCEEKIIISGSKPWEMEKANEIFGMASKEALEKYIFCFNFTQKKDYPAIREGMEDLNVKNVHFLKYIEDPFLSADFVDGDEIFEVYLPEKQEEEKKGFFKKRKGEKNATPEKKKHSV